MRKAIAKILCVLVLTVALPVGAMGGTVLAHVISGGETTYQTQNGGFGLFCANWYQDLSHGSNGWVGGGYTHSIYGASCPQIQDLGLGANELFVMVHVQRSNGLNCDEFTSGINPNIYGSYAFAVATLDSFCGAPATGSKRVLTYHESKLYGVIGSEGVLGPLHSSI